MAAISSKDQVWRRDTRQIKRFFVFYGVETSLRRTIG